MHGMFIGYFVVTDARIVACVGLPSSLWNFLQNSQTAVGAGGCTQNFMARIRRGDQGQ
jgi:hypothetical protein